MALREFEAAYVWVKNHLLTKLRAYAMAWLESLGRLEYHEQYQKHR